MHAWVRLVWSSLAPSCPRCTPPVNDRLTGGMYEKSGIIKPYIHWFLLSTAAATVEVLHFPFIGAFLENIGTTTRSVTDPVTRHRLGPIQKTSAKQGIGNGVFFPRPLSPRQLKSPSHYMYFVSETRRSANRQRTRTSICLPVVLFDHGLEISGELPVAADEAPNLL